MQGFAPHPVYSQLQTENFGKLSQEDVERTENRKRCCIWSGVTVAIVGVLFVLIRWLTWEPDVPGHAPVPVETCVDTSFALYCGLRKAFHRCPEDRCMRTCTGCTPWDEGDFYLKEVRTHDVENKLAYARTGSAIPTNLHGIWWMDQTGFSVPELAKDYSFNFMSQMEVLITFGDDAQWHPETQCVSPVPFYGGTVGHWTTYNNASGVKNWNDFLMAKLTLAFCFTDATYEHIIIWARFQVPEVMHPLLYSLGFQDAGGGFMYLPHGVATMTMTKTPWGWDRPNNALASWTRDISEDTRQQLKSVLPRPLWALLEKGTLLTYVWPPSRTFPR
mmetsp:Transcript_6486/g.16078  ORF Transcript_6486/g.16078 Transcript_6486/m.16078 type:complete len:332 (-) Transcript_6486:336-1331(-)